MKIPRAKIEFYHKARDEPVENLKKRRTINTVNFCN